MSESQHDEKIIVVLEDGREEQERRGDHLSRWHNIVPKLHPEAKDPYWEYGDLSAMHSMEHGSAEEGKDKKEQDHTHPSGSPDAP